MFHVEHSRATTPVLTRASTSASRAVFHVKHPSTQLTTMEVGSRLAASPLVRVPGSGVCVNVETLNSCLGDSVRRTSHSALGPTTKRTILSFDISAPLTMQRRSDVSPFCFTRGFFRPAIFCQPSTRPSRLQLRLRLPRLLHFQLSRLPQDPHPGTSGHGRP